MRHAITFIGVACSEMMGRTSSHSSFSGIHLHATLEWLKNAHDQGGDGGVSYGYSVRGGWRPSYRETSGYLIPSFFDVAHTFSDSDWRERAITIAKWLVRVQNHDGSYSNPRFGPDGIVFDTGQVLLGLVRAYQETADDVFARAAKQAARWLVHIADGDGRWTHNEHLQTAHVYNTRTAWALLSVDDPETANDRRRVALSNLEWAVAEQDASGFFHHCAFRKNQPPFTHTLAYAASGLLESAAILDHHGYRNAARRCADAAIMRLAPDGFLPGRITPEGLPRARFCCITGNCQFAIIWGQLYQLTGEERYRIAMTKALDFVMRHQDLTHAHPGVRGGVRGSWPIWGGYAPFSFPNWAAKFFIDALLIQRRFSNAS